MPPHAASTDSADLSASTWPQNHPESLQTLLPLRRERLSRIRMGQRTSGRCSSASLRLFMPYVRFAAKTHFQLWTRIQNCSLNLVISKSGYATSRQSACDILPKGNHKPVITGPAGRRGAQPMGFRENRSLLIRCAWHPAKQLPLRYSQRRSQICKALSPGSIPPMLAVPSRSVAPARRRTPSQTENQLTSRCTAGGE
jgi:hypothetical protein